MKRIDEGMINKAREEVIKVLERHRSDLSILFSKYVGRLSDKDATLLIDEYFIRLLILLFKDHEPEEVLDNLKEIYKETSANGYQWRVD